MLQKQFLMTAAAGRLPPAIRTAQRIPKMADSTATAITAAMVKDLRESTGAGMMDCKAALTETGGDMQAAQDRLGHDREGGSATR